VSAGIVLVIAGIWVAAQVLGGDALQRTGVIASDQSTANWNVDPNTGVPNQDPNKPLLRDPQGRPY
jgi:hypothetical protein